MKHYIYIVLFSLFLLSCTDKTVQISGEIKGLHTPDSVLTIRGKDFNETFIVNSNGTFKTQFEVEESGQYDLFINKEVHFPAFLKTSYDLKITGDAMDIFNTIRYEGKGAETNNFIIKSGNEFNNFVHGLQALYKLDKDQFSKKIDDFKGRMKALTDNNKVDTAVLNPVRRTLESKFAQIEATYQKRNTSKVSLTGKASPKFVNYENHKGGTTSLEDFKGKYVYIDVWATWCRPCLQQVPYLKQIEKEYRGKNIAFIGISTDKETAHDTWKNMVTEKGIAGTQLFSGHDRSFMQAFQINSIPRFIFIGPEGEIINANAPRPSQKEALFELFEEVGL